MTPRSVELMREGLAAFSRGDFDGTLALIDPDVEWHAAFLLPDLPPGKTVYRGHDEVRNLWEAFTSAFEEMTVEMGDPVHASEEVVVARVRFRGRGAGSGVEVDRVLYYVQRQRDERLVYCRAFDTEREALEAAGVVDRD